MIEILFYFLETTRKNGLILNKRKLQFKKEEVSFFGPQMVFLQESPPDPKKTESILKMQFPPDKETMHSFLGDSRTCSFRCNQGRIQEENNSTLL